MNLQIRISAKDDQGQVLISVEKNRRESYKTNPKTAKQVFDSRCSMNFDSGSANRSTRRFITKPEAGNCPGNCLSGT